MRFNFNYIGVFALFLACSSAQAQNAWSDIARAVEENRKNRMKTGTF